jgi:hypothetical protein
MSEPIASGDYPGIHIDYHERPHRHYLVNGQEAVSVTTALGILNKPALLFYAERETADGMRRLAQRKGYQFPNGIPIPDGARGFLLPNTVTADISTGLWLFKWSDVDRASKEAGARLIRIGKGWEGELTGTRIAIQHMKMLKTDHTSKTSEAAERGVDVHSVWEAWSTRQEIPNANAYPENRRGYIRSMAKFIRQYQPKALEAETVVGSAVHGFAGRLDTVVVIRSTNDEPRMLDVKTSKGVYPSSHFPQLAGYELARVECGLEPTTQQGILRLDARGGDPEVAWSNASADDFLAVLGAYKSQAKWMRKGKR